MCLCRPQDAHRQRTIDWIDATGGKAAAFDFTTKGVLQEAVAQNHYWRLRDAAGKPPGVLGWWPSHAVTFVEVCCPCCQCEIGVQVARPLGLSPFLPLSGCVYI